MSARVDSLRMRLEEPLLVTHGPNVRYLTDFASSNAALLVEPERVRLFADFRYAAAGRAVEGVDFVETERSLLPAIARLLPERVGFEAEHLPYAEWEALGAPERELVPTRGAVERLRAVKDDGELEAICRAATVTDRVYEGLAHERFRGRSERELAWRVEQLFHDAGAEGLAFAPIVASGPNAAHPHHSPGDRIVEEGDTVIVDSGALVSDYCSDCTRTFAVGPLPKRLREAYAACLEAQLAALEAVRPGAVGREVDAVPRERIDATEFRGSFGHGLGHGLGLVVHETPTLRPESEDVLEPGNVVTVEPGIYLEGLGGIRIEDLVIVREEGPEILSRFTKELLAVD